MESSESERVSCKFLSKPIGHLANLLTSQVKEAYQKSLTDLRDAIILPDRYLREKVEKGL